jgi:small subunit ribosomal protein S17
MMPVMSRFAATALSRAGGVVGGASGRVQSSASAAAGVSLCHLFSSSSISSSSSSSSSALAADALTSAMNTNSSSRSFSDISVTTAGAAATNEVDEFGEEDVEGEMGEHGGFVLPTKAPKNALVGRVVSTKMNKTAVAVVIRMRRNRKYGVTQKRTKKFMFHDEVETAREGDTVMIQPCRPLSRHKSFTLTEVLKRADIL